MLTSAEDIYVVCRMKGTESKLFSEGKKYLATKVIGRTFILKDDKGQNRVFIPNEPCPHLIKRTSTKWPFDYMLGIFETAIDNY